MTQLLYIFILTVILILQTAVHAEDVYKQRRQVMVEKDIKARGISDAKVLQAMGKVPRHLLVDEYIRDRVYEDYPLPIGEGRPSPSPMWLP